MGDDKAILYRRSPAHGVEDDETLKETVEKAEKA